MKLINSAGAVAFQKNVVKFLLDIEATNGILYFALPKNKIFNSLFYVLLRFEFLLSNCKQKGWFIKIYVCICEVENYSLEGPPTEYTSEPDVKTVTGDSNWNFL